MICLPALLVLGSMAIPAAAEEPAPETPLRFRRLTTDDGLSDSTVLTVFQDRQGFMWFGTADGLNRYDGHSFKVYQPDGDDPHSLSGGYVWEVTGDRDGDLWVSTSLGLNRYVRETD